MFPPKIETRLACTFAPFLIVTLLWSCLLFHLAEYPLCGDGAELLRNAQMGGVLHPPGFPLQSLVNKLWLFLPFSSPTTSLSFGCWVAHLGTLYLLISTSIRLGLGFVAQLGVALVYGFYAPLAFQAIQPEVFALTYFLFTLIVYESIGIIQCESPTLSRLTFYGVILGLALSQNTVTTLTAPCVLAVFWHSKTTSTNAKPFLRRSLHILIPASLISIGFYLSLLFQKQSIWPNWGELQTPLDVFWHMLRKDYGILQLDPRIQTSQNSPLLGLTVIKEEFLRYSYLSGLIPFVIFGLIRLERLLRWALLSLMLFGIYFISLTNLHLNTGESNEQATAVLIRFHGPFLISFALLVGLGIEWILTKLENRIAILMGSALILISLTLYTVASIDRTSRSVTHATGVLQKALQLSLPKNVLYLAANDLETFYGIEDPASKKVRFGISQGMLHLPWYLRNVIPRVDSRIHPPKNLNSPNLDHALEGIYKGGLAIATIDSPLISKVGKTFYMNGILYIADPNQPSRTKSDHSLLLSSRICETLQTLEDRPETGLFQNLFIWSLFSRWFGHEAEQIGSPKNQDQREDQSLLVKIADALEAGQPSSAWKGACIAWLRRHNSISSVPKTSEIHP